MCQVPDKVGLSPIPAGVVMRLHTVLMFNADMHKCQYGVTSHWTPRCCMQGLTPEEIDEYIQQQERQQTARAQ